MRSAEEVARESWLRAAVLRGDERAWSELYDQAFAPLAAWVGRRLHGDRGSTEDVLQEVWMVAVRRIRRFDPRRGSFLAWLHGIAENVLRNRARSQRRRPDPLRTEGGRERLLGVAAPIRRDDEEVALAMADLPEHYRAVLGERYEDQSSVAEIAARRGASPKSAESLLGRARTAFRRAYRRVRGEA